MWKSDPDLSLEVVKRGSWDGDAAVDRLFKYAEDDNGDLDLVELRGFFFLYDDENEGLKKGYKLPFADIVSGEPKIIYEGLTAVQVFVDRVEGVSEDLLEDIDETAERIKIDFDREQEQKAMLFFLSN